MWEVTPGGTSERLKSSTVVTDGVGSGLTTSYDYWPSSSGSNSGQIQRVVNPDGSWTMHGVKFNSADQTTTDLTVSPFGSTPPPGVVADFDGLKNLATLSACVEEEQVTRNTYVAGLPPGFMLSRARSISSSNGSGALVKRVVSKRQFNAATGFYEDLNPGSVLVLSTNGDWSSQMTGPDESAVQIFAVGRNGSAPIVTGPNPDFTSWSRTA
jgi:hypothetical protein